MTFVIPPGKACKLQARVVHANKAGVGLCFINAHEAYRQLGGYIY